MIEDEMSKKQPLKLTFFGNHIMVNGHPLYYESSPNYFMRIKDLSAQYQYLSGLKLKLITEGLEIPLNLPISALTMTENCPMLLEKLLNMLNSPNSQQN